MITSLSTRAGSTLMLFLSSCALVACGGNGGRSTGATALPRPATAATIPATAGTPTTMTNAASPPGGPAPAELIGSWTRVAHTADAAVVVSFTADGFRVADNLGGGHGELVVNGDEIDLFNVRECGLTLPEGVGRYRWSLMGSTLSFTPLNTDPCPVRGKHFAHQDFIKSSG